MIDGLGEKWVMSEIWVKKYPCCFLLHRQIDSVIELKTKHNLSLEEVASIDVHASPADVICNRPEPKNEGDLQFSFQHVLSAAMLDGDVNTENICDDVVNDPKYTGARPKVNFILHDDRSNVILVAPSQVVIKTKDGRELSHERIYPIGHPEEPLAPGQFRDLYAKFTRSVLPEGEISRTADAINRLETLENVQKELAGLYS
jgi:2-methylcitrate dehydratase PrpD